ncbi:hypothetical protein LCGC14_3019460, partial [marine sediment metagenome]
SYLIYTLVEKALSKGYRLVRDGKEHPKNKEIMKLMNPIHADLVTACSHERLYGKLIYEIQQGGDPEKLFLNYYDPRDFTIEIDEFDVIKSLELTERADNVPTGTTLEAKPITSFDNIFYRYRKGKRSRNRARSYLEPFYDLMVGIENLAENAYYFVIRVGAGLKIIYVSKKNMNDADYMEELESNIQTMNAENTTMILGYDIGEEQTRVELLTAQAISFKELLEFYFTYVSLKSEVPITILQGVTPGQLEGGKINENLLFDLLRAIQKEYERLFTDVIDYVANTKTIELGEYEVEWETRAVIDEVGVQALINSKIENLEALLALGVDFDKATKLIDLPLTKADLDQERIAEKKQMRDALIK